MERTSAVVPPASWTIVMSFAVVSIDLGVVHQSVLSAITLWFAGGVWLFLVVVLAAPLATRRGRSRGAAGSPVVLASVAATAVLGTRLVAAALLVAAATGWVLLLPPVLRHWSTPTTGISFVVGLATDALALLNATLSVAFGAGWFLWTAALLVPLGLVFYAVTAARFDLRHGTFLATGGHPGVVPELRYATLSLGKAGLRAAVSLLHDELAPDGVHVTGVAIGGAVARGGALDPDRIAETYWALHTQPARAWTAETHVP